MGNDPLAQLQMGNDPLAQLEMEEGNAWDQSNADSKAVMTLLQERGATHGNYGEMANTIQRIKVVMRDGHSWPLLTPGQQEALELIATKIGRIVEGDPNHHDHWADLSGYATKGLESCR